LAGERFRKVVRETGGVNVEASIGGSKTIEDAGGCGPATLLASAREIHFKEEASMLV
jgi:hypothetical protein